jgi:hypothetical protein
MASSSKRKTTMAKIMREQAVRERRQRKQARRDARKQAKADEQTQPDGEALGGAEATDDAEPSVESAPPAG